MNIKKLVLALIATAFVVSVADAQTARRAGMDGNPLIEDHDDVYIYPQKAQSKYNQNRVKFDMDANGSNSGTLFSGNGDAAWGVAINKLGDDAVSDGNYREAVQTFDAFWSTKSGGADMGLRVGFASGSESQGDAESSNMDINLAAGYSRDSESASHDIALNVDYGMGEVKDSIEGTGLGLGVNYRGYLKNKAGNNVDLGIIANVGMGSSTDTPEVGDDAENKSLGGAIGAGPVFRAGASTVALLAGVGYFSNTDAEDNENVAIFLPGVNVAFESPMNDWMTFRGGIGYTKAMTTNTPDVGDESQDTNGGTTYALGLSAQWEKLTFDIALNRDFLINGPHVLTGTPTANWASQASATFEW